MKFVMYEESRRLDLIKRIYVIYSAQLKPLDDED